MPPRVYIETTIPSYLTSRPSRDIIIAGHQQITLTWWETDRQNYELYVSQFVLDECAGGDAKMAQNRLELLTGIPILEISVEAVLLSKKLIHDGPLPQKAETDALHISIAASNAMDYLLTWNLRHIANPAMERDIHRLCRDAGFDPPVICTPEELLGEEYYVEG
ncbi:MAG: type II toxin-antitoxin system VapC family toxin [Pyrinomonadaceae bacterium]